MRWPAILALLTLLIFIGCNRVFYQPSRKIHGDAAAAGFAFEDIRFPTANGDSLHGMWFPHDPAIPHKGLWVFFHGNSRNISGSYNGYAWVLREGYDYFVFDYRGYGRSDGNAGREEAFEDGLAALRYASHRQRAGQPGRLILAGESLGGAVLLASAAAWEDRHTASLVFADCTFPSYRKVARAILAARPYSWPFQLLGPPLVSDAHAPQEHLASLAPTPLLITHCESDEQIPITMGLELYANASAPRFFWKLPKCRHSQGFTDRFPENRKRLMAFVDSLTTGKP